MSNGVFIVGTGRCGSTLLSQVLATHARTLSLSEYFTVLGGGRALSWDALDGRAFLEHLVTPSADLSAFLRHADTIPEFLGAESCVQSPLLSIPLPQLCADPRGLHEELAAYVRELPVASPAAHHERLFQWLARRLQKSVWVERSGGSLAYVSELVRCWPSAKFVHLARYGPDCVQSMARHPFFRVKLARILADDPELPVDACLSRALPLDRFAALWSADMVRAERILGRLPPEHLLLVRYEDLLEKPGPTLRALAQFIDQDGDHADWIVEAARRVRAPASEHRSTGSLGTAYRAGMHVYGRMRTAS